MQRASLVIVGLTVLLVACGGGNSSPTPTPTPTPTPPGTSYGANLIVNPGAEVGGPVMSSDTHPITIPGWTTVGTPSPTGVMDAESYGVSGDLQTTDPGPSPSDRGANYFSGGGAGDTATATQSISLSSRSSDIDAGKVSFDLSGWLGGFSSQNDNAVLSVQFLNSASATVGSATSIGPVLAADRQNASGLLFKEVTGSVPVGTRSAVVTLVMTRTDGIYNDGYADNLSLKLSQ